MPHTTANPNTDGRPKGMGHAVGAGATWMLAATMMVKVLTFVSQIMVGQKLTKAEFGLVAMAVATTKLLSICQDAGVRDILVQHRPDEYKGLSGRIFWFAAWFNISVALFIAAVAYPLANVYFETPELTQMLLILAVAMPLGTPGAILQAKLRLDLRFSATSWLMVVSALVRQVSTVSFAFMALGAMSFMYPAIICALIESIGAWWLTRDAPWKRPAERHTWRGVYEQSKWLIFGSMANLLIDRGPYLVMKPVLTRLGVANETATVINGVYYWAYEMTAQIGVLLSYNLQLVLTPVFARLRDDLVRMRQAAMRSLSGMMMIGSIASLGLGVVMDPLEKLIFNGKWSAATPAIMIFGLFFPFRILYGLTTAIMVARKHTKAWCFTSFAEGIAFTLAAVVAGIVTANGWIPGLGVDAESMAWFTGGTLALGRVAITLWVFKGMGVQNREVLPEMFWPWLLAVLAAGLAWYADHSLKLGHLVVRQWSIDEESVTVSIVSAAHPSANWIAERVASLGYSSSTTGRLIEGIRFLFIGTTCSLAFVAIARTAMPDVLREAIRVAPGPLALLANRVLRLPPKPLA